MVKPRTRRRQRQRRRQQPTQSVMRPLPGARTHNIVATSTTLVQYGGGVLAIPLQPTDVWPAFRDAFGSAIEYRITHAVAKWTSTDVSQTFSMALTLQPPQTRYEPKNLSDMMLRGAVIKPVKTSGWSTQPLMNQPDAWYTKGQAGARLYTLCQPPNPNAGQPIDIGLVQVSMTFITRG
jgi:hypothetical protein